MTSRERREQILERLKRQGQISVADIVEHFGVSKMTGHRDLEYLENRGLLKRIFGGAIPAERRPEDSLPLDIATLDSAQQLCTICMRPPQPHLVYRLTLNTGETRVACCPHCGVSAHLALREQVVEAEAVDNLSGQRHPAQKSFFLFGSSSAPCCHPSILTFAGEEVAERFQAGFGGQLGTLGDAIKYLIDSMSPDNEVSCPHCKTR